MHRSPRRPFAPSGAAFRTTARIVSVLVALALPSAALATPVVGFVDHIASGVGNWGGGDVYSNPGAGGVLGASDGFLVVSTRPPSFQTNLGARSLDPAWQGNWTAAGVAKVKLSLKDVGAADPLELHFGIGNGTNFWQYDIGFVPTANWTEFTVDLASASWTQIIGTGTFASALAAVDRILIRHDVPAYTQLPDAIEAEVGIDEITLVGSNTAVPLPGRGAVALALAAPSPNPSSGPVALAMATADLSPISIVIVDAAGRRVRRASLAGGVAGTRSWTWDGRTDTGAIAPAGVYRVRASNASGGTSRPLVRIAGTR